MQRPFDRVVVITDDVEGSGGASSIALASVRQLRRLGVPVTVLTGEPPPPHAPHGLDDAVLLGGRHLLAGGRMRAAARGLHDGEVRARLSEWIAQNDTPATVYHLHNWHKVLSPACFAPLRRVADRLVLSTHDFFLSCPNGGFFDFQRQAVCELTPLSKRCIVANCDKRNFGHKMWRVARHLARRRLFDLRRAPAIVLAVHEGMVPLLERGGVPGPAVRVLRNPVTPWRSRRIEAERNRSLLYVGRLELDKGVDVLARAAGRAGAKLVVVGDGPLRSALPELCPGVEMLGWLPPAAIGAIAADARAVVLPTRVRETFGLVALEAAMSGLPVVASTSALVTEELVAAGAALPCAADRPKQLADSLEGLLADDATVEAMSRRGFFAGRALAPTEDQWGERLLALYAELVARVASARAGGFRTQDAGAFTTADGCLSDGVDPELT